MPNFYNEETEKERHYRSLDAAAEIAEKASMISLERNWPIEKATEYVRKFDSRLATLEKCGYLSETESRSYAYTSKGAGDQLAEQAKELMKSEGVSYDIAISRVYADPKNDELMRCYAQAD